MSTCPRRMGEFGPWEYKDDLDLWRSDRWDTVDGAIWKWPWKPRTCSFCGGVYLEDALKLLAEGWEINPTDKRYKAYLEPPGFWQAHHALLKEMRSARLDGRQENRGRVPSVWSPTPPVKVYIQHWVQEELDKFNVFFRGQRELRS